MANVRLARLDDAEKMSAVLAASWKSAYRGIVDDEYLDLLKDDHWIGFLTSGIAGRYIIAMVLEENHLIVGSAILGETQTEGEIHLISFYLSPDKIGKGLGSIFYGEIENEILERGYDKCILDVLVNNERAIRFYERQGFSATGAETPVALGSRDYTCIVMEKTW